MINKNQGNPGLLFYKHYYRDNNLNTLINKEGKIKTGDILEKKNQEIINFRFKKDMKRLIDYKDNLYKHTFKLKTTYPGLLIGTGLMHNIGVDEEFKIGLQFDYTTGLPIIPGSSVKGLLRSAFPDEKDRYFDEKREYIESLLSEIKNIQIDIESLRDEIFEGTDNDKRLPLNKRDIFFDAVIIKGDKEGKIFGEDYITPHDKPLKDPDVLKFLKILPGVTFEFRFDLKDSKNNLLKADKKLELFKRIILDLGIGAKTNVGYGNLVGI